MKQLGCTMTSFNCMPIFNRFINFFWLKSQFVAGIQLVSCGWELFRLANSEFPVWSPFKRIRISVFEMHNLNLSVLIFCSRFFFGVLSNFLNNNTRVIYWIEEWIQRELNPKQNLCRIELRCLNLYEVLPWNQCLEVA